MPTLVNSYAVHSAGADTTNLVTPSFTPSNGEVLAVKLITWDTGNPMGAVSGGSQTYTTQKTVAPGGFNAWARIVTAVVSGSPGSMTVTAAGTATNSRHSMVVERWSSASLAGTPAVNATSTGSGAPSFDIVTTAANSAIAWCLADANGRDPATRAYRLSAVEDGLFDGHVNVDGTFYFAYSVGAAVTTAGTYTNGLTAPNTMQWVAAGIEILDSSGATTPAPALPLIVNQAAIGRAGSW